MFCDFQVLLDTFVGVGLSACLIVAGSSLWLLKIPPPPRPRPCLSGSAHVAMNVCRGGIGTIMRCVAGAEVRNLTFLFVVTRVLTGRRMIQRTLETLTVSQTKKAY